MEITLTTNGEARIYETDGINMRASIDAYKLLSKIEAAAGEYDDALIDEGLHFVRAIFGNQFTTQDLLQGCTESFFVLVPRLLRMVVAGVSDAIGQIPNATATTTTSAG